ncbi:MAG: hypothetical protein J4F36_08085 [Nitrosopumilaceae archaeon]|nr:hypothetical protein [Nitrosopumilaceae archaeon]
MKLKIRANDNSILESNNISIQLDQETKTKLTIITHSKKLSELEKYLDEITLKKLTIEIVYDE